MPTISESASAKAAALVPHSGGTQPIRSLDVGLGSGDDWARAAAAQPYAGAWPAGGGVVAENPGGPFQRPQNVAGALVLVVVVAVTVSLAVAVPAALVVSLLVGVLRSPGNGLF